MKGIRSIFFRIAAVLLAALPVYSCSRIEPEQELAELSVSIYIPDMSVTKAETGTVGALDNEKLFSSLQLWVFMHGGKNDGVLVGYKGYNAENLAEVLADTGVPYSAITRFGMVLTPDMYTALSAENARVDVYALANAASVTGDALGQGTTRSDLDGILLSGTTFGTSPLTMSVPGTGLPMSGVLKNATVTGGYPVFNVSTVTLTRAVSKIRFVFSQQGKQTSGTDSIVPSNASCVVRSISFGGTSAGHDCQIAQTEKLFTEETYGDTDNLFDIDGYTPLSATLAGEGVAPLMDNGDITVLPDPEELLFRSPGHETESAREYESRLDAAIAASSRTSSIYIRETDKRISGTIVYNAGDGEDKTVTFYMPADNVLTRNHSWILYAYFAEATRTLQLKIVVLPWDKSTYDMGFTTSPNIVNVVRRFSIPETEPQTFAKIQNINGYFDIYFWHTLNAQPNVIKGDIIIDAPVGQKIHIVPVAGALEGHTLVENLFTVSPEWYTIYPRLTDGYSEDCKLEFEISCNPGTHSDTELEGNYIDLHFCVEIQEGGKTCWVDLDSESIDYYRLILEKNWDRDRDRENG